MLKVGRKTLENGLRVLVLHLPHVHSVSHALLVRTGPRFETEAQNGISHLVEHLLFRGTESHPDSLNFHVAVESLGGEINGLTQRDACTVQLTVPPRTAVQGLELLAEACTEPLMTGLDVERDVVIEEILDTFDSEGCDLDIDTISRRIIWEGHSISLPVAGELELVEGFTEQDCRAHFERTFVASNAVLCIAGPVDEALMFEVAERAFQKMPRGVPVEDRPLPTIQPDLPIHVQPTEDSQVSFLVTYPAPAENHPDFAALLLLKRILDDGFGARLRQAVCEQRGLAYSLAAAIDAYHDIAAFDLELSCAPKKLLAAAEQVLITVEKLTEAPIPEDELNRAKIRHVADLEFALDDPSEICGWYGGSELLGRLANYEDWHQEVMAVTAADLQRLAQQLFQKRWALVTLVGPISDAHAQALEHMFQRPPESTVWFGLDEEELEEEEPEDAPLVVNC